MPEPPWRGEGRVLPPGGSVLYALSYLIAVGVGYGGGASGEVGLVFVVVMIACLVPMMITSASSYWLRNLLQPSASRRGLL